MIIRNVTRSKLVHKVWDMVTTYIRHTLSYDTIFSFIYLTYTRHIPYEKGICLAHVWYMSGICLLYLAVGAAVVGTAPYPAPESPAITSPGLVMTLIF